MASLRIDLALCSVLLALSGCGGDATDAGGSSGAGGTGAAGRAGASARAGATGDSGDTGAGDSGGSGAGDSGDSGPAGRAGSAGRGAGGAGGIGSTGGTGNAGEGDAGDAGDAGSAAGGGEVEPLPFTVDYAAAASPLAVTPVLDPTALVEIDVPLEGATLSVTGANGTLYTLVIPDEALTMPTRIRMHAVSSLTGAPEGIDAVHGVQLEPSGLQFLHPATLTIEPSTPVPPLRQAFFGYDADGDDLHLVPGEHGAAAELEVLHFSGYGMAMLAREISVTRLFADVVPKDAEARLSSAMAKAVAQAKAYTITGYELNELIDSYLTLFESEVLPPLRNAIGLSCANALTAARYELMLLAQRQRYGLPFANEESAWETLRAGRSVCFEEANQRCRVSGNVEELIATHRRYEYQAELFVGADPARRSVEETAIDKCGRYELEFDSTVEYNGIGSNITLGYGRISVTARVPLKLAEGFTQGLEGTGEISHTEAVTSSNCVDLGCGYYVIVATSSSTTTVRHAKPQFAPVQGPDVWSLGTPVEQVGSFSMECNPGQPTESVEIMSNTPELGWVNTSQLFGHPPSTLGLWTGTYYRVNMSEVNEESWYLWNTGWTQSVTYPVMFERVTSRSLNEGIQLSGTSTEIRLVHKPI